MNGNYQGGSASDRFAWLNATAIALVLSLCSAGAAVAQPANPSRDLASFKVADGFEVQLYAADPAIAKPIQMNFDAEGKLWVVSSESYPQLEPGAPPRDKVFVLEDRNRDGRADKTTLFADGLLIPTGIEVGNGGAYVGQSTELIHLQDTDGDGKADTSETVLSGFGTEDTHHLVHTFRWGPEGLLHFAQSIYIHSHIETPWGVRRLNGGGFWMLNPNSLRLSVLVHGMVNSWGIAFNQYGQAFGVDNDHQESSIKYFLPGARLRFTPGESLILKGIVQAKPKYCGAEFISGRHFPADWNGNLITCDFRAHRVVRYKIEDRGAGYEAIELDPLITTSNIAFRPIDVKLGPDGALYICDWYNPIINHGEVDFRDPRRDKTQGRIWRVVHKNRKPLSWPNLKNAGIAELLDHQKSPEQWTRHFSRRVLAERPRHQVLPEVDKWIADQSDDLVRLRGLWIYHALGELREDLLLSLADSPNGDIRATAVRMLTHWIPNTRSGQFLGDMTAVLHRSVRDPAPRVRMEAVRALASLADPTAVQHALVALEAPLDPFLEYALKLTARETAARWIPTLSDSFLADLDDRRAAQFAYALLAVDDSRTATPLLQLWKSKQLSDELSSEVLRAIGRHGDAKALGVVLSETLRKPSATLLQAIADAHRARGVIPQANLDGALTQLLESDNPAIQAHTIRLAASWNRTHLADRIIDIARSPRSDQPLKQAAITALGSLGSAASKATLAHIAKTGDLRWRIAATVSLARRDPALALESAIPLIATTKQPATLAPLFQAFVQHRDGPELLAAALKNRTVPQATAKAGLRTANSSGLFLPELVAALTKAGGLKEKDRTISPGQLRAMASNASRRGNGARGRQIYQREKLGCVKCHTIDGVGGKVGPDLSSIGASAPVDYLIESMLLPNKAVKENYHTTVIATLEGQVLTGIVEQKTDQEWVLRDAENKLVRIPAADIEQAKLAGSLMPTGVIDELTAQEFLDLVRYLSDLGKASLSETELTARRWSLLGPFTGPKASAKLEQILASKDILNRKHGWRRSLTTNAGWVYLREFALNTELKTLLGAVEIEVTAAGNARFAIEPAGRLWWDGKPLGKNERRGNELVSDIELTPGTHSLMVEVDLTSTPRILKLRGHPLDPETRFRFPE